jgi:hypothetical protein
MDGWMNGWSTDDDHWGAGSHNPGGKNIDHHTSKWQQIKLPCSLHAFHIYPLRGSTQPTLVVSWLPAARWTLTQLALLFCSPITSQVSLVVGRFCHVLSQLIFQFQSKASGVQCQD